MLTLKHDNGDTTLIKVEFMDAMTGWEMQHKYREFVASKDYELRKNFTFEVLSFAKVITQDNELPLKTDALVQNHLRKWELVKYVFEEVLKANGIDPEVQALQQSYWSDAGTAMAIAFIAETSKLLGPAMEALDNLNKRQTGN